MNATKTIPIVMTGGGGDAVEAGFIESLARPGGNVTGALNPSSEKAVVFVRDIAARRAALLRTPN